MSTRPWPTFILVIGGAIFALAGAASADLCKCSITVYSTDRWMDPWWGLECDEHCGHGYVGHSCDTAHGEGCGAMTGYVKLRHSSGSTIKERDCPDDHRTCFKGPSACDSGGSWGNVCNADTWHCVPGGFSDGSWECNGLSDPGWVYQTSASNVYFSGACGTNWFNVLEYIKENDPWCCDDPMGYLNASAYTANGTRTVYLPTSYQNCNGGSQGGVYPHCGTFGATLAVVTTCSTVTYGGGSGCFAPDGSNLCQPDDFILPTLSAVRLEGEEPGGEPWTSDEARRALAVSVERRESKMAEISFEHVAAEVADRARAMRLTVPLAELTKLVYEAGTAELARDACRARSWGAEGSPCQESERRFESLRSAFHQLSGGWQLEEFRSGSALIAAPPAPVAPEPLVKSAPLTP